MTAATSKRYDPRTIANMMRDLEAMIDSSQESLENEEDKDYPNDERIDMLNGRIDSLQEAFDALQAIEA